MAKKNLLLLGAIGGMSSSTKLARSLGYRAVVADYYADSQAKKYSDKNYLVSTTDIEALKKIIEEEKIEGIFTGFSDVNIRTASRLSQIYGFPCYINEQQLTLLQNKLEFKRLCSEYGISAPRNYKESEEVNFPVIVKPSDAYASKGISVCNNYEELSAAIEKAREVARNKEVVIEDYLDGREIMVHFVMLNGKLKLTSAYDRIISVSFAKECKNIAAFIIYNVDRCADLALRYEKNLERMFKDLGFENLVGFLQGIYKDDEVYFFEPAVRFGGNLSEIFNKACNGVDIVGKFIDYSCTGVMNDEDFDKIDPYFNKRCFNVTLFLKKGIVTDCEGIEEVEKIDGILDVQDYLRFGREISDRNSNGYDAVAFRILFVLDDIDQFMDKIAEIRKVLKVYDENGNDIIDWEKFDNVKLIR